MDALNRTTDIGAFSYGLGHDQFGDYAGVGATSHGQQGLPQDFGRNGGLPGSLPIVQFMHDDAPWNPLRANATVGRPSALKSRNHGSYMEYQNFPDYRNTAVPSECEDSGYYGSSMAGSLTRPVDSVYGDPDCSTETGSFVQPFSELHLQPQHSQGQDSVSVAGEHRQRDQWSSHRSSANPDSASLTCPTCKGSVKTKAELNKHKLRHDKPFVCNVAGCTRKQGFGTQNDLARHQQSVHSADGIKYRCYHEGPCKTKQKNWPRADNFKQHLKRVHSLPITPDMDLSSYEYKPSRNADLACLGSSEAQVDMPAHPDHLSPLGSWMGVDQSHESSGPPSGEIGYVQLDHHVLDLHNSQQPVDDHGQSLPLDADESEHRTRPSLNDSHLQLGMHSALPYGNHQSQSHGIGAAGPAVVYQDSRICETDVLSPADLMSSTGQRQGIDGPVETMAIGADARYVQGEDESQEQPQRKDVSRDQLEQPLSEEPLGQDSTEEDGSRDAGELALLAEDEPEEGDEGAEGTAAVDDLPVPNLDSTPDSNVKAPHSPCTMEKLVSSEMPLVKSLLGDSTLDESEASALVKSLMDNGMLDKIIMKLGYQKAKEEEAKAQEEPPKPPVPTEKDGADVPCLECPKKFKRPCELKKHMKRHEKPYACTHSDCPKRFGSKNDWKRHENSQHIQLEFWKCAEKARDAPPPSAVCGRICHRRETFKSHLDKDHGITDDKTIEKRCTDCRNGRNFESRFWCGFCKTTIEFGKNGGLAWSERFDHIDAHFTGKDGQPKMDIKTWKSIELEPLETFEAILPPEPRPATPRVSSSANDEAGQNSNSRKRRSDGGASSQSKRVKSGSRKIDPRKENVLWTCCNCNSYWNYANTTNCMESECGHQYCDRCHVDIPKPKE